MEFQKASEADFHIIQKFYWDAVPNVFFLENVR